uniref:Uncharacterized protein n=1 Tax=Anopheles culicifacies TaxID=139723 RepID=A0A182MBU2_9DIPT
MIWLIGDRLDHPPPGEQVDNIYRIPSLHESPTCYGAANVVAEAKRSTRSRIEPIISICLAGGVDDIGLYMGVLNVTSSGAAIVECQQQQQQQQNKKNDTIFSPIKNKMKVLKKIKKRMGLG